MGRVGFDARKFFALGWPYVQRPLPSISVPLCPSALASHSAVCCHAVRMDKVFHGCSWLRVSTALETRYTVYETRNTKSETRNTVSLG